LKNISIGFLIGLIFSVAIAACATNPFPFDYYGVDLKDQKLLGSPTWGYPDLPLSTCDATAASASPCVGMLTTTLEQLKTSYEDIQDQLIECQKKLPN
jgi:hypothetical protein